MVTIAITQLTRYVVLTVLYWLLAKALDDDRTKKTCVIYF